MGDAKVESRVSRQAISMPPLTLAAAMLREITERLAREVVEPSDAEPEWSELEWAFARAVATMQGIATLLANRLRWTGPPPWQSYLAAQQEQSILRYVLIGEQLHRLDTACCSAGIGAVALKGAALRRLGLYEPGERPMGDIDLLIEADDFAIITKILDSLDYVPHFSTRRHEIFRPRVDCTMKSFGEHVGNPLRIEIHTRVAEPLPVSQIEITSCLTRKRAAPGLNAYPNPAALMLHLLLHAAGNMRANALRQIQIHDIAALSAQLTETDWLNLLAEPGTLETRWWLYPPLALTDRYYPGRIPVDMLREARAACPIVLRFVGERKTLSEVSWSNLRIRAVPGIAWSRSLPEAIRYIRSRAMPSRTALDELQQGCDAQPHLYQVPWYGFSHGKRFLRWLASRPPRVQTLVSLRAVLENADSPSD